MDKEARRHARAAEVKERYTKSVEELRSDILDDPDSEVVRAWNETVRRSGKGYEHLLIEETPDDSR
jgi:hypothetical protein